MSQSRARPPREVKSKRKPAVEAQPDAVPAPEDGDHPLSHAAHLDEARRAHPKPAGNERPGSAQSPLREPAQRLSRVGKQHRGQ